MTIKALVFDAYGTLYDIQSVAAITEEEFPGYGEIITQIWRIKQLEYTWLRSLMRRYEDFSVITRDSLAYTLRCLGLKDDPAVFDRIMEKYLHLDLYPDAKATLAAMKDRKLAILSNGSTDMLNTLVREQRARSRAGRDHQHRFQTHLQAKSGNLHPDRIYARHCAGRGAVRLIQSVRRLRRQGLRVERRMDRAGDGARRWRSPASRAMLSPPLTMFKAIRMQMDELGLEPDFRIKALADLPGLLKSLA